MIMPTELAKKVVVRKWEGIENLLSESELLDDSDEETSEAYRDYLFAVTRLKELLR